MTLADLALGETGQVVSIHTAALVRRRMLDLGLVPGTEVQAILKGPAGSPIAYAIRGTVIAFRRNEAGQVLIQPVKRGENNVSSFSNRSGGKSQYGKKHSLQCPHRP